MMPYLSNEADYHKLIKDGEEFNKKCNIYMSVFFKKNDEPPKKDKEKAQDILNCRLGNFSR